MNADTLRYLIAKAEQAGTASVKGVSGTDLLELIEGFNQPSPRGPACGQRVVLTIPEPGQPHEVGTELVVDRYDEDGDLWAGPEGEQPWCYAPYAVTPL